MSPGSALFQSQGKEAMRRANLSAALASVRLAGRQSRSQLIRSLQLSRTTVFELVGQLVELGLVSELERPEAVGVGRPSFVVSPSTEVGAYVVNPESDALTIGVVDFQGRVIAQERHPTRRPLSAAEAAQRAVDGLDLLASALPETTRIGGIGVALPGQVDRTTGLVRLAPRLGWRDVDIAGLLEERAGLPVRVDNNARLVAHAEHMYGKGRGRADFAYIFAGAGGIGGANVVNDRIVDGRHGYAGEIGHIRLTQDASADFGGITGTLEALVRRDDIAGVLGGGDFSDTELHERIRSASDDALRELASEQLRTVGVLIGNIANVFDPELIILGGFIGSLYERYRAPLEDAMRQVALPVIVEDLEIASSVDNSTMTLIGAAELVFNEIVADPIGRVPRRRG